MSPKFWIVVLIALLIGSNAYWFIQAIDTGITQTYREATYDSTAKSYDQAIRLANMDLLGLSANEALAKIGVDAYGSEPFEKDGCIYTAQICVRLDESRTVIGFASGPDD